MENVSMLTTKELDLTSDSVLPQIPEIFIDERKGHYLVLNPLGPWWFVGSKLHADFAALCDGKRSLGEIRERLSDYDGLTDEHMVLLAQSLQRAKIFTPTEKREMRPLSVIFFNITRRCNLRCPYCYYDSVAVKDETYEDELDSETWIELAGRIAEINPKAKIMISGGEPLIRPDAVSIIENIAQRHNVEVKLITNGTLFTDEIIERLSRVKKFSIQVSIDSMIPELNDKTREKGSLDKSMDTVRKLKAAGIDFVISSTVTSINIDNIRGFRDYCIKNGYGFRSSIFTLSGDLSKSNNDWLGLTSEQYFDACTYALEDFKPDTTMGHPVVPGVRRYGCGMGYGQMDISPDGSVFPCSHLNKPQFLIGNIKTSSIQQLIAEGEYRYGYCEVDNISYCTESKCPVRYFCTGGCRANTYNNFGEINARAKYCDQHKQSYISALWVYMMGPDYLKDSGKEDGRE
ncbi:radical SAM protein with 4Fe4S-binding SPASM domain [Anaerobacterium chartisolvens]|uniref:Radical SAM protein with 4Fe4S-binding SPASM domain n=1 Tax=Anaerobacterium chartisolvens TaxID=1297424 RepID=A0A369ASK2_9FIRM|nr:radical SAM protein [Anaerobacterium chartisolvens]RCX12211.1 radical SAM protein with 4Fe4S-binding SPASM domain [Anaerobacterium chartisolvens]